jgi:hypothetical protein
MDPLISSLKWQAVVKKDEIQQLKLMNSAKICAIKYLQRQTAEFIKLQ